MERSNGAERLGPLGQAYAFTRAVLTRRPIYAQLIVTRRCNLSCGYCFEYDQESPPVPLEVLKARIDGLHRVRTFHICMMGGEPLLHPEIDAVVAYAARRSQVSLTTNGFLLSDVLIDRLNATALSFMQVSVDQLHPDRSLYVQKTLKTLRAKLLRLKERATFRVVISMVLCEQTKGQFKELVHEAKALGLPLGISIANDRQGQIAVRGPEHLELLDYYWQHFPGPQMVELDYTRRLLRGERPTFTCRGGSRYLYVDEHGQVQACPAQPGKIGRSIVEYTDEDVRRHYDSRKGCESGCAVMCVYRASALDNQPVRTLATVLRNLARLPTRTRQRTVESGERPPTEAFDPDESMGRYAAPRSE